MASLLPIILALAGSQTPIATQLNEKLDALAVKHFRGVLYVEREGKEAFFHSVGFADPDTKRPFTKATGIEIGSIVKPIVGTAVYRLAEAGKLSLSDSIAKYFPDTPADKMPITVEMLIKHTSGFQDTFGDDYDPMKRDELMQKMLASELLFVPGEKNEYSNSGYSMLTTIMEKVTGEPMEQHISKTQFKLLNLTRTGYVLPKWKSNEIAIGYGPLGKKFGSPLDHFWFPDGPGWNLRGNGGMITTVGELSRWCWGLHNGELIKPESYRLFAPKFAADPVPDNFWGVAGGNGIFNCVLAYNPAQKLTVVAFSADGKLEIEKSLRDLFPLIRKL